MQNKKSIQFSLIGLLFIAAAQYPIVAFFNFKDVTFFGVPSLLVYILFIWVILAFLIIWFTLRLNTNSEAEDE